jgi:hypothetical protein
VLHRHFYLAVLLLVSGCVAQMIARSQQAVYATLNTADAVIAACGAPALTPGQSAPTPGLPPDQAAAQQAAIDARDAVDDIQSPILNKSLEQADQELARLSRERQLVREYMSIRDAIENEVSFLFDLRQSFESVSPEFGGDPDKIIRPLSDVALVIPEISRVTRNLARLVRALAAAADNSAEEPGTALALRNLADQLQFEADHPSTETLGTVNGPLLFPNVDKVMGLARDAESLVEEGHWAGDWMADIDAEENFYAQLRANGKATLQDALNRARAATLAADAQVQKCGGQPITTRIPGYSETFWDISS